MTALAEVAIEALVGTISINDVTASFACHQLLFGAFGADVNVSTLAVDSLRFWHCSAAILTFNRFHRALLKRVRVIKFPNLF